MTVTLCRAAADDAATLSALAISTSTEAFGDSYPPHDLHDFLQAHYSVAPQRAELNDPLNAAWLLRVDDTAVGYLAAGPNSLPHPRYGCSKVGEYDFIVGASADREHILRRPAGSACA